MAARGAVLGIGRLLSLDILDPRTGRSRIVSTPGRWIGWIPGKKCFCICRAGRKASGLGELPAAVRKAHAKFHQAAPRSAMMVDVPKPVGALTKVGLLKALVYDVPGQIRSPGKNKYHWHHAFGDTGHAGGDSYPTSVMPAVLKDRKGNWFIRRRPGNIFTVDTWLRG